MLKISTVESPRERSLILEGMLVNPWADELISEYDRARVNLDGRQLVLDLKNVTVINQQGENVLITLMNDGVKFRCGLFARQVLRDLARRARKQFQETKR